MSNKIALVKAFMQIEGNLNLNSTMTDTDGSVAISGYNKEKEHVEITMDKHQVEIIEECESVMEIYACYKEMEYF